jgi:DNA polymerase-3 subunit delta'
MRLEDLAGQDRAVGTLRRALRAGRVPHAYLFDGPAGVGKRTAAQALALALICPDAPGEGCGACDVCRRALAGNHPDLRLLAPETAQIVIDQIQEVVALAATRPHEAPARIIVIDDADRMNVAAGNALLKTLEEPAPNNHLVLVTGAPERLLTTIRSRTQRIRFVPVPASTLVEIAVRRGADRARAETAAAIAGGSVARTLELASADGEGAGHDGLWRGVDELRRAAGDTGIGPLFDTAGALGDKEGKETLPQTLALLARLYRDALAQAVGADDLVLLRERAAEVESLAARGRGRAGVMRLRRALGAVVDADAALAANVNAVTALEKMLMDLRACEAKTTR